MTSLRLLHTVCFMLSNIIEAINQSGLKQKFIAEKVGISEAALSSMLNGNLKIDADVFFAIACVLRMTPDEIYGIKKGA